MKRLISGIVGVIQDGDSLPCARPGLGVGGAGTDAQRTAEAAWAAYEQAAWKSKPAKALPANGAAGTRTQDQRIKSPMLYRLSYSPGLILPRRPRGTNELESGRRTSAARPRRRPASGGGPSIMPEMP